MHEGPIGGPRPRQEVDLGLDAAPSDDDRPLTHNSYPTPSQTRAEHRHIKDLVHTREVRVLSSKYELKASLGDALRPSSVLCRT